ncbi:MAG: hypothetical protein V1749_11095 [Candidatus Desantisbacteria bacterium]
MSRCVFSIQGVTLNFPTGVYPTAFAVAISVNTGAGMTMLGLMQNERISITMVFCVSPKYRNGDKEGIRAIESIGVKIMDIKPVTKIRR